jgi:hypothetical protein
MLRCVDTHHLSVDEHAGGYSGTLTLIAPDGYLRLLLRTNEATYQSVRIQTCLRPMHLPASNKPTDAPASKPTTLHALSYLPHLPSGAGGCDGTDGAVNGWFTGGAPGMAAVSMYICRRIARIMESSWLVQHYRL